MLQSDQQLDLEQGNESVSFFRLWRKQLSSGRAGEKGRRVVAAGNVISTFGLAQRSQQSGRGRI